MRCGNIPQDAIPSFLSWIYTHHSEARPTFKKQKLTMWRFGRRFGRCYHQYFSQYGSLPETMQMVDFSGILVAVLGACILSLVSVALTFWLARAWISEQPELGERIIRLALAISISFIVVFGGLAGGLIVLRTLWTIGFF